MDLQPYLIAVDAGGTKTEAVLFTADGTIVRHLLRAGINPLVSSFDAACSDCLDIMRELCAPKFSLPKAYSQPSITK